MCGEGAQGPASLPALPSCPVLRTFVLGAGVSPHFPARGGPAPFPAQSPPLSRRPGLLTPCWQPQYVAETHEGSCRMTSMPCLPLNLKSYTGQAGGR